MDIALIIIGSLLGIAFAMAGGAKVAGAKPLVEALDHVGASKLRVVIGLLEVAAAIGLIVGIWVPVIAVAAAVGLVVLMAGAVSFHVRAGDGPEGFGAPALLGVLAAVFAVLRVGAL